MKAQKDEKRRLYIKFIVALLLSHLLIYMLNNQNDEIVVEKSPLPTRPFSEENYSLINLPINLIVAPDPSMEWVETTLINIDNKEIISPCYIRSSSAQNKNGSWELGQDLSAYKAPDQSIFQIAVPKTSFAKIMRWQKQVWDALPIIPNEELKDLLNRGQSKHLNKRENYEIFY